MGLFLSRLVRVASDIHCFSTITVRRMGTGYRCSHALWLYIKSMQME